jgi:hypothetical protein
VAEDEFTFHRAKRIEAGYEALTGVARCIPRGNGRAVPSRPAAARALRLPALGRWDAREPGGELAPAHRTGTSTNAVSKAAHDMARARGAGPRLRRRAASAGYVVCELAKEVPYYASASGAALLSDAVSAGDAIVFLAGTNVGAAVYECAVAGATRKLLRRR